MRWKWAALALTFLALLLTAGLALDARLHPARPFDAPYRAVVEGGDYLLFVPVQPAGPYVLEGRWTPGAAPAPDRVLIVDWLDVERIAEGDAPFTVFSGWRGDGSLSYAYPRECRDGCPAENLPVLLWARGDAWVGVDISTVPERGWGEEAPVRFEGRLLDAGLQERLPVWRAGVVIAALSAAGAAVGWARAAGRAFPG